MKILLITDTHDPKAGGAEKYFFGLRDALKHDVYTFGFGKAKRSKKEFVLADEGLFMRQIHRMITHKKVYRALRAYINEVKPDVIHLHNINKSTPALLKACAGYPTVMTVHDYGVLSPALWHCYNDGRACTYGFRLKEAMQYKRDYGLVVYATQILAFMRKRRMIHRYVDCMIAPAANLARQLKAYGYENVQHVSHYLEGKKAARKGKRGELLYLGALEENKGVQILLEALRGVEGVHLTIAGRGSYEKTLRDLSVGLPVTFKGYVKDISKLYNKAQMVIVPSIIVEQFGLVTAEAMQHAKPVIGSKRGGTAWLVEDGKTGLLYDAMKPEELRSKIVSLVKKPALAEKMGLAGQKRITTLCDKKKHFAALEKIYFALSKK